MRLAQLAAGNETSGRHARSASKPRSQDWADPACRSARLQPGAVTSAAPGWGQTAWLQGGRPAVGQAGGVAGGGASRRRRVGMWGCLRWQIPGTLCGQNAHAAMDSGGLPRATKPHSAKTYAGKGTPRLPARMRRWMRRWRPRRRPSSPGSPPSCAAQKIQPARGSTRGRAGEGQSGLSSTLRGVSPEACNLPSWWRSSGNGGMRSSSLSKVRTVGRKQRGCNSAIALWQLNC